MLAVSFEGAVTRFIYDDGDEFEKGTGRLKAKQFFDNLSTYNNGNGTPAEEILYSYDPFGRLVAADNNGAETTYEYDARGQVIRTASPEGAINYEYDDLGRKSRTTTGDESDPVNDFTYEYDSLGRLSKVTVVERNDVPLTTPEETAYAYDLQGNLDLQTNPNGVISDYDYDILNRLTDLVHYLPDETPETLADNDKLAQFDYTVRDDGRRTSATETFWFDETEHVNHITWTYDDAGRLIDEVFDHYDNQHDQTQHFIYDLTGNRLERTVDLGNDMVIDQVFSSAYDANDRLITEEADTDNDNTVDQTTTYGYTGTQQTGKTVTDESTSYVTQSTAFAYDLQGRMHQVLISTYDGSETLTRRERTTYDYDHTGIRVSALHEVDSTGTGTAFDVQTRTQYLVDHRNFTGYQQVLEETVTNEVTSELIKKVVYTIGHDQIAQTTFTPGGAAEGETLVFHADGHGSVRVLTDLAGAIATFAAVRQIFHFDAYGNAIGFNPAQAATSYLYSGEQFDSRIGQQYLRARYYDPATGRFNRLDPFFGNLNDPQSLHKYLYTHADPVNGWDPTGKSLIGTIGSIGARIGAFATAHPFITAGIVGFLFGIALNTVRNIAVGNPWHQNWWEAGKRGAVLAPLALKFPIVAVGLALYGLFDSVGVALEVLRDAKSTIAQKAAAGIYLVVNVFFAYQVGKNVEIQPPIPGKSITLFSGVPRFGMSWKTVTDVNGKAVEVYGQPESSSTTPGHTATVAHVANVLAQSGRYVRVYMQRSWRTATGRDNPSGKLPDILAVNERGVVDAVEVASKSDTHATLNARLKTGMESGPPETQGQYTVIDPGHMTDPFH